MRRAPLLFPLLCAVRALSAQQWTAQSSGTSSEFRGLHAVNALVVWAAGRGGVVAHTRDGGNSWTADSIPGAARLFLIAVHGLDAERAWVAGTAFEGASLGRIYSTRDGGSSWRLEYQDSTRGVFLDGMAFWDSRHGIAFGDPLEAKLLVVTTADGGAHWSPVPRAELPVMLPGEAAFAASGTAILVTGKREVWIATGGGARARVFQSSNRGQSWQARETPAGGSASKGIFGIARGRSGHAVAVGGDYRQPGSANENLLLSEDGGRSWSLGSSAGLAGVQYGIAYAGGARFVAVGPEGSALSRDGGRTWNQLVGPGFNTVSCVQRSCWAAGTAGKIARMVLP